MTRTDRKYVLPADAVPAVLDRLPSGVRVLDIDGQRSLRYRSVYFDTPDLACYRAAAHRRRRRYKVRVRSYLDTGAHFAEVKIRGRRGVDGGDAGAAPRTASGHRAPRRTPAAPS